MQSLVDLVNYQLTLYLLLPPNDVSFLKILDNGESLLPRHDALLPFTPASLSAALSAPLTFL